MSEHFISFEQAESDMLACAAYIGERINSSDGHAEAMLTVVPRFLSRGDVDLAAELANTVDDPFTRNQLLTLVAEKCAEVGDDEYAFQLADSIDDVSLASQALEKMAVKFAGNGDFDRAREITEGIAHPEYVQAAIASALARAGRMDEAETEAAEIEFAAAKVTALQLMAEADHDGGNAEAAVEKLHRAGAEAEEIEHDEEKVRALCEVGGQLVQNGAPSDAAKVYNAAFDAARDIDGSQRDAFLATVAVGLLHSGDDVTADEARKLIIDKTHFASVLLAQAREQLRRENKDEALSTLEEAYDIASKQRDSEIRDSRSRYSLLNALATQFAGFGKTERGIEAAQLILDEGERNAALGQIAQILVVQKENGLARETVEGIDDDWSRLNATLSIADAKTGTGDSDGASSDLGELMLTAADLPTLGAKYAAYVAIGSRLSKIGKSSEASEAMAAALESIGQIRDESSRAGALAELSDAAAATGFSPSVEDLRLMMRDSR